MRVDEADESPVRLPGADDRSAALGRLTLPELLDAYADARLERRADEMERLNREIETRRPSSDWHPRTAAGS